MQKLEIVNMNNAITETAIDLIETYSKSHGLRIPDALIAATAICSSMELLTHNVRDFRFIERIRLYTWKDSGQEAIEKES